MRTPYPIRSADAPELRLRFERIKRRLTQRQLGHAAGVRQSDLSQFELGRMNPTTEELDRLARVLCVSPPHVLLRPVRLVLEDIDEVTP